MTTRFPFDYDRVPPGYYDRVARHGTGLQKQWHLFKFRHLVRVIQRRCPSPRPLRVVDLGCGPGTFLGLLAEDVDIVGTGVDISRPQVDYAARVYGSGALRFLHGEIESAEVLAAIGEADVVTCVEVIEHIDLERAYRMVTAVHGAMRPGALFLLTTPNYLSGWPVLERAISAMGEVNYEEQHILHFNRVKLQNMLATCGFDHVEVRSFLHASPFVAGTAGVRLGRATQWLEERWLRHAGPLLCAEATRR